MVEQEQTVISAEEAARIAAIVFEAQDGLLLTDAQGVILRVNQAFTRLTGYTAAQVIGRTPALLQSGHHDAAFYKRMWLSLEENGYWQGEIWNRHKSGSLYAGRLSIFAVKSAAGLTSHYLGSFSEVLPKPHAETHFLADCDPLTHLPGRSLLFDRLSQALAGSTRSGHFGALLFLDMDLNGLRNPHDGRGMAQGDALLVEVVQRLQRIVRGGDTISRLDETISRLGGDEFVLLLEHLSGESREAAAQARQVAEKICEVLSQPYDLDGMEYHCALSLGVTLFYGREVSLDGLLNQAGLALDKAREAGGNSLCFFDPEMQAALDERSALMADLRWALQRGQFQLFFQAQVDAAGRTLGAEVLLRWRHPRRGLVPPGEFMALAEETGLILPIGLWVLEAVCNQLKDWSGAEATRELRLSLNVSARQFRQPGFVEEVEQVLAATGADPHNLKMEIGGGVVQDDVKLAHSKMHALKSLGIGFSLDDFGIGNSSLAYLTRLPLEQLKINRAFVRGLPEDLNAAIIAKTIVVMAESLGLNVIAEGVETQAQREFLAAHHCHFFQGFLFSQPLPLADFEAYVGGVAKSEDRPHE